MPVPARLLSRAPWGLLAVVALTAGACTGERPTLSDEVDETTTTLAEPISPASPPN